MPANLPSRNHALARLAIETLIISPSGALSPGVLSTTAVIAGVYEGAIGGFLVALGHMLFEAPYVAFLAVWANKFSNVLKRLEKVLALATFLMALFFALGLISDSVNILYRGKVSVVDTGVRMDYWLQTLFNGVAFTAFNPYFLAWWLTIGLPLVRGASEYGIKGFAVMYTSHVWLDYVWLILLAIIGSSIASIAKLYGFLLLALSIILILFGLNVFTKAYFGKQVIPF